MCCGHATHLCHVTQIQQNEKCGPMSHFFGEFNNEPILLCHDNAINNSMPAKQA